GDLFSRKHTLIVGVLLWMLGYVIWILGHGFALILTGELMFAFAIAFISGTIEAYLYDLLKKRHKEGIFHKKYAKMKTLDSFALMIATLTGAFVYQFFGPTAPLYLTLVCLTGAVAILWLLPDVPESRRIVAKDKSKWQDITDISKYAVKHSEIKWLMISPALYGTMTLVLMWGLQSVMTFRNLPVFVFSLVLGANAFMRTFWSSISGKILEKIHLSGTIKLQSFIIVIATLGACLSAYVPVWAVYGCLILMIVGSASSVLSGITTSVLVNHRIKSDERATVLSVKSMMNRAFQGIGLICLKPLFDNIGVGPTFMATGLLLIPVLICAWYLYKMKLTTLKEK
ncbi:MAG: MFS transporter, partial [Alphaproteobacteria bacterium]|nr:MFS transporter [Alphaproteobacteria bacterium]